MSGNLSKTKKNKPEEEDDIVEEDEDERADQKGFDLRGKSLKNTTRRDAEPKKAVLPLKAIMDQILEKPSIQRAAGVGLGLQRKILLFRRRKS